MKITHLVWVVVVIYCVLIVLFAHTAMADEISGSELKNGDVVMTKKEFSKLQQFVQAQHRQLELMAKQLQRANEAYQAAKDCVLESARQGVATTPCFQDCKRLGMDCPPSTVEN